MLPLDQAWYRRLLGYALVLGLAAGTLSLLYSGATGTGINLFFGDAGTDWWSGEWWWVPLIAGGGLLAAALRRWWDVPDDVPGAVPFAKQAWVDPASAPRLAVVSAVSLIFGASLGPSFGLVVMGGGVGAWLVSRLAVDDEEAKQEYALAGMAGGLGSAFSAPLFAAIMASELSPTAKSKYVAAFIPQLIAASLGFVVFFGVTGRTMLDAFEVPPYQFEFVDLLIGAGLGIAGAVVLLVFVVVDKLVARVVEMVGNQLVRGVVGGALVGLIAFALPLTLTSGSSQLSTVLDNPNSYAVGFLAVVLLAKMVAVALSLSSGFLGGNVFPMIFLGGTSGVLVHLVFPDIPLSLAVAGMMAAVPGAFLDAPVSLILIAAGTVGLDPTVIAPVAVATVMAYLAMSVIRLRLEQRQSQV